MNTLLFTDIAFDSDEAWQAFQLMHGMAHQQVYDNILRADQLGNVPFFAPLFDFPREDNQEYLLDHWTTHLSNAKILGIVTVPDLSSVDLSDPGQYSDWLAIHAQVHATENAVLGI